MPAIDQLSEDVLQQFSATPTEPAKVDPQTMQEKPIASKKKFLSKPWQKILAISLLLILVILTSVASYTLLVIREMKQIAETAAPLVFESKNLLASQNIKALPEKVTQLKTVKEEIAKNIKK